MESCCKENCDEDEGIDENISSGGGGDHHHLMITRNYVNSDNSNRVLNFAQKTTSTTTKRVVGERGRPHLLCGNTNTNNISYSSGGGGGGLSSSSLMDNNIILPYSGVSSSSTSSSSKTNRGEYQNHHQVQSSRIFQYENTQGLCTSTSSTASVSSGRHNDDSFHHHQYQIMEDPQLSSEPEVYLPIKKRRVKDLLESEILDGGGDIQDFIPPIPQGYHQRFVDYSSSSHASSAAAANNSADCDNSEEWWYYANQEWGRSKSHNNASSRGSKCVPSKGESSSSSSNNGVIMRESVVNNCGVNGSSSSSTTATTASNAYCDSIKDSHGEREHIEEPEELICAKVSIYDKSDPRSDEYRKWLRSYYPMAFTHHYPTNPFLVKMHLVDPTRVGNKFPPWVSPEGLKRWDIGRIAEAKLPMYSDLDVKIEMVKPRRAKDPAAAGAVVPSNATVFKKPVETTPFGDMVKTKEPLVTFCKPGTVISYVGHSKSYEINF